MNILKGTGPLCKVDAARLEKWKSSNTVKPSITVYRTRTPSSASQPALLSTPSSPLCPLCEDPLVLATSTLGEVLEGFRKVQVEVREVEDEFGRVHRFNEDVLVTKSIPVTKRVRVCPRCVPRLSKVILEKGFEEPGRKVDLGRGRMKESTFAYSENPPVTKGLTTTRFDRASGFRGAFHNRKGSEFWRG